MKKINALAAAVLVTLWLWSEPVGALNFEWAFSGTNTPEVNAAYLRAGDIWSAWLNDDVTIRLTAGTTALAPGTIGQSSVTATTFSYSSIYSALYNDRSSAADFQAVSSLSVNPSFGLLINRTADDPYGSGAAAWYVDNNGGANNSKIRITTANAKALGISTYNGTDGFISMNSSYAWDYDPTNGISQGEYDFVGVVVHEIGHELGFVSGVDYLDSNVPLLKTAVNADQLALVRPLDLFRYSQESTVAGVIDWSADSRDKYFSIDNGHTVLASFSTGANFGDGHQASHWKDNLSIGFMDPTASAGELLKMSGNDLLALDVIGWNVVSVSGAIPEPDVILLFAVGVAVIRIMGYCRIFCKRSL